MGGTVEELITAAIAAEEKAYTFYEGVLRKFRHAPHVAAIWQELMNDEDEHRRLLEKARANLTPEELQAPADPEILYKIQEVLRFSPESSLQTVRTLDDAYAIALDLENSEVNAIFEFILNRYVAVDEADQKHMVDVYLRDHIRRLQGLREEVQRRNIQAVDS